MGESKDPATAFLNSILPGAGGPQDAITAGENAAIERVTETAKAPKLTGVSVQEMSNRIAEGLKEYSWFVTGQVDSSLFADDFKFSDPSITTDSLPEYARGVSRFFSQDDDGARMEVISVYPRNQSAIEVCWYLEGRVNIPGRPRIKPYIITTTYRLNEEGLINYQEDEFSIPGWDIALSILFPWIGAPAALRPSDCFANSNAKIQNRAENFNASTSEIKETPSLFSRVSESIGTFFPSLINGVTGTNSGFSEKELIRIWSSELKSLLLNNTLDAQMMSPSRLQSRIRSLVYSLSSVPTKIDVRDLDGIWRVVWTEGILPWQAFGPKEEDRAYQAFRVSDGKLLNAVASGPVNLVAGGQFELINRGSKNSLRTPTAVLADVNGARLRGWNREFDIPINGQGEFEILHLEEDLRIFRSQGSGGITVQVRAEIFPTENTTFIPALGEKWL
eukprot:CAMPEP_0167748276 /NCGR_PEP_ID=MMETSP0110_2-20121227/4751_1 /TAXON_ID=629695 /ORGANISM="Gymnochlora sp., Strain CCMP2014" /LENGTH=447 /DNA_ID=CAMNT_0007633279 /DNA_START=217 /DNA_END=1560 /DNA_ORIENTATION=-